MKFLSFLRSLWALPCTVGGLLIALLGASRYVGYYRDALVFCPRGGPVLRFFDRFGAAAFTWGQVIVVREADALALAPLMVHEYVHTEQAKRWGIFFPLAYVFASLIAWDTSGEGYEDNAFEQEAKRAGQQAWAMRLP